MARITTAAGFTGQVGSCRFVRGEGETDNPGMLSYFARHSERFTIEHEAPAPGSPEETDEQREAREASEAEADKNAAEARAAAGEGETDNPGIEHDESDADKADPADDPYAVSVAELRKLCSERSIPQAGSKAELQERLRAYDDEHAPSDAE